jgi:hypothetical protein
MAKPTHHAVLLSNDFRLVGSEPNPIGTTHHYVQYKKHGNDVRPLAHHVIVHEFNQNPGKYNVSYHITRLGQPYQNGEFDKPFNHRDNQYRGVRDPIGALLEHHGNISRGLNLAQAPTMRSVQRNELGGMVNSGLTSHNSVQKRADAFDDVIKGAGSAGPCWACGKATYNRNPDETPQRDSSMPISAAEATDGEMHGPDINLCGDCATDPENYHMAVTHGSRGPGRIWHWSDDYHPGCPECEAHLMDQADEDLRP